MFGTREFRFSYTVDGETRYVWARNLWQASQIVQSKGLVSKVERAPLPKTKPLTTGHCQICAREIGTTNGVIAHHGYKRPGTGWQTASCFGARRREYEVAHDALDEIIPMIERDIELLKKALADWSANPPETITYRVGATRRHPGEPKTVERPADFDPTSGRDIYSYQTYAYHYRSHRDQLAQQLKWNESDLKVFRQRRAEWKAPK